MSYDITIMSATGEPVTLAEKHQLRGGTFALGGTDVAELNVTYNYAPMFREAFKDPDGIKTIALRDLKTGLALIQNAILNLKGKPSDNYWNATEGNARKALCDLAILGNLVLSTGDHDDAIWEIH